MLVSILVVVDQFPEENPSEWRDIVLESFNPCCGGSVSGGLPLLPHSRPLLNVSILVVVDQFPEAL